MIPCSSREKEIALSAQALIRDFGGNSIVDAHEAAVTAELAGDHKQAEFMYAVVQKIEEYFGGVQRRQHRVQTDTAFQLMPQAGL